MKKTGNFNWKGYINYGVIAAAMIVFAILSLVDAIDLSTRFLLEEIAIKIILAVSLSLVVGFLGELSLGHAGFMCVGAFIGGKLAAMLTSGLGNEFLTLVIAVLAGGACAAACGFLIGLPALRLRGDYLAITTLAFVEIVKALFTNSSPETFGGPQGLKTVRFDNKYFYLICFAFVLVTLFVIQNLINSKHGRAIKAVRDNEIAARATGINITRYKLLVFILSAAFAGIAGVLYSFTKTTLDPKLFDFNYSIDILIMVVIGGMGSINGSIIAAVLITILNRLLPNILPSNLAVLKNMIYALVLILIVIYRNAPALKDFREKYNTRTFLEKIKRKKSKSVKEDT